MKTLSKNQLRKLINEELVKKEDAASEMNEFSNSNPGKKVIKEGKRIMGAGKAINAIAYEQTGGMRRALNKISEFVYKTGKALSEIDSLKEGDSVCNKLPSVNELKQLHKEIQKLEKLSK
jgi:hypothetical protein